MVKRACGAMKKRLLAVPSVSRFVFVLAGVSLCPGRRRVLSVLVDVRWSFRPSSQENRRPMMVLQRRLFGASRWPSNFA